MNHWLLTRPLARSHSKMMIHQKKSHTTSKFSTTTAKIHSPLKVWSSRQIAALVQQWSLHLRMISNPSIHWSFSLTRVRLRNTIVRLNLPTQTAPFLMWLSAILLLQALIASSQVKTKFHLKIIMVCILELFTSTLALKASLAPVSSLTLQWLKQKILWDWMIISSDMCKTQWRRLFV